MRHSIVAAGRLFGSSLRGSVGGAGRWTVDSDSSRALGDTLRELLTFDGCPALLRATPLSSVMRCCAAIFKNASGSEETYLMSHIVPQIDVFVSHNWVTPRLNKFLALCFYFNSIPAFLVTLFMLILIAGLQLAGYGPTVEQSTLAPYRTGCLCRILGTPIYMVVVFFMQDVIGAFRLPSLRIFLDKTSIHQVDHTVKQMGITKLGAFIRSSEKMVVLYTGTYLRKLWTVYEVAAFLTTRDTECMSIVPVHKAIVYFAGVSLVYLYLIASLVLVVVSNLGFLAWGLGFAVALAYCLNLRLWSKRLRDIEILLKTFSIRDCSCAVESDRPVVYANIRAFMQASKTVGLDASEDAALDAFDNSVRRELPVAFRSCIGAAIFDFSHLSIIWLWLELPKNFDYLSRISQGMPMREAAAESVADLANLTCTCCFCVIMAHIAVKKMHDFGDCFAGFIITCSIILLTGVLFAGKQATGKLSKIAYTSNLALVGLVFLTVLGTFVFFLNTSWRWRDKCWCCRRVNEDTEMMMDSAMMNSPCRSPKSLVEKMGSGSNKGIMADAVNEVLRAANFQAKLQEMHIIESLEKERAKAVDDVFYDKAAFDEVCGPLAAETASDAVYNEIIATVV